MGWIHFPFRKSHAGVIGAPSSGENGLVAHAGVAAYGGRVECVAEGGVGAAWATGALGAACGAELDASFTLVAIPSVIKIAKTAAIKLTATGRGGWK